MVFAPVSLSGLVFLTVFAVLSSVFLFLWGEVTAWDLVKKLVGNLLCAVAKSLEGEGRHLSKGPQNPDVGM